MRKVVILAIVAVLGLAGVVVYKRSADATAATPGAGGGRGGARPPMPVEFADVKRGPIAEKVTIVGNLIGAATVEAVPKVNGRLQDVHVRLGDRVRRGQPIAKVEDREIREQVRQAEAAFKVSEATIRQREADLKLAQTNLERNKSLLDRQLLPRQTYDDTDARHQAAVAQLDLARAQFDQSRARLDELQINLSNTVIASPVDGFIGKRYLDPGASVSPNVPVASVVDIRTVRMVANVIEKDIRRLRAGMQAQVQVDAFPGDQFVGRVSRVAPVFDPQTRTAEMEVEVPNEGFRLKPGMYARVELTVDNRPNALTIPRAAVVDLGGKIGAFVAAPAAAGPGQGAPAPASGGAQPLSARFVPLVLGIRNEEVVEVSSGLNDGARVITTGAMALKDGDRIVASGRGGRRGNEGAAPGGRQGGGR